MAKFAPVAPIQVLEQLYDHSPEVFGEYHLLLAHHTVEYADRFERLFRRIHEDGIIRPLIIMDNSVVECGGFVDLQMMEVAVEACQPQLHDVIPVLPDVMGSGLETRLAVEESYNTWVKRIPCAGFMAVCQGEHHEDFKKSFAMFSDKVAFPYVEFLGIPRYLVKLVGSRKEAVDHAVQDLVNNRRTHKIHLLGYSDDTLDDLHRSTNTGVYGIDSAVPLRVDDKFSFGKDYPPRPKDWFDRAQLNARMLANLGYVRQMHQKWENRR